jgi:hypothetical protein
VQVRAGGDDGRHACYGLRQRVPAGVVSSGRGRAAHRRTRPRLRPIDECPCLHVPVVIATGRHCISQTVVYRVRAPSLSVRLRCMRSHALEKLKKELTYTVVHDVRYIHETSRYEYALLLAGATPKSVTHLDAAVPGVRSTESMQCRRASCLI